MNRNDFQQLAEVRIRVAKVLLDRKMYGGAYYLAGYAVECALKACIAKLTKRNDFPPNAKFVNNCYTHDIEALLRSAALESARKASTEGDNDLKVYWEVVTRWNESSRYDRKTRTEANDLYRAIADQEHGVLKWIKDRW